MFNEAISYKVNKSEITHEDLVDILSTGLTGNSSLGIEYDAADEYKVLPAEFKVEVPCIEDMCAALLLAGKSIYIVDMETIVEDKNELEDLWLDMGKQKIVAWGDDWACGYEITLDDIIRALEDEDCMDAVKRFIDECADLWDGDAIIQTAAFGEVVFG